MTEGPITRVQAPSHHSSCTCQPQGLEGSPASPHPSAPTPPPAEESGLEPQAEATSRRQPPNSCPSARQPETHNRTAANRGSEGSFQEAECNCLDWNFPGPPANPASILSSICFSSCLSRTLVPFPASSKSLSEQSTKKPLPKQKLL